MSILDNAAAVFVFQTLPDHAVRARDKWKTAAKGTGAEQQAWIEYATAARFALLGATSAARAVQSGLGDPGGDDAGDDAVLTALQEAATPVSTGIEQVLADLVNAGENEAHLIMRHGAWLVAAACAQAAALHAFLLLVNGGTVEVITTVDGVPQQ